MIPPAAIANRTRGRNALETAFIARRSLLRHQQQQKMRKDAVRKYRLWARFVIVDGYCNAD